MKINYNLIFNVILNKIIEYKLPTGQSGSMLALHSTTELLLILNKTMLIYYLYK